MAKFITLMWSRDAEEISSEGTGCVLDWRRKRGTERRKWPKMQFYIRNTKAVTNSRPTCKEEAVGRMTREARAHLQRRRKRHAECGHVLPRLNVLKSLTPCHAMEESIFAANLFLVENVLNHLETEELFTCAEVNRLWQAVALFLLRRKLVSVSVCCTPDSERATPASALGSSHVCVDIFCSKFSRFRNIARMAGLRPSLVFLSHHVDLGEDKRAVERLRELLPPGSVIVYFKLELVGTVDGAEVAMHEGIFGEFLFHAEEDVSVEGQRTASEEADDQPRQPPDDAIPGPSSLTSGSYHEWWRPRVQDTQSAPQLGLAEALPGPSTAVASLPPWPPRPCLASAVGGERGALFRNVLPGVLVFQALHVTAANLEGDAVTSYFTEEATGRTVQMKEFKGLNQRLLKYNTAAPSSASVARLFNFANEVLTKKRVTSAAVFSVMQSSQLEPFMRRLSEQFGSTNHAIAVAFPRNQDEALGELEAFERYFPSVPALANQATEFNVDGQYAPMSRLKMILLLIKLLD